MCGRTKDADCRLTGDGLVLCHTVRHLRKGETLQGHDGQTWVCVKESDPQDLWTTFKIHQSPWVKPTRPAGESIYEYPDRQGNPLVRVKRIDDGQGRKRFIQEQWDGHQWRKGLSGVD
ncbi:MAG: hypothetical protein NZL92_10405, partial [Gloeomargarita sp. SKYG116]|nr:hypothetical protein [Gloeomargarita sp. SKYG116]MDW8402093.1 hypothetical protein [Gloeomargarita sp. SKYGB_i_bin116]